MPKNYPMIQNYLKKGWSAASNDKKIFEECFLGKMSLKECKKQFLENNDFPNKNDDALADETFKGWLKMLGYRV